MKKTLRYAVVGCSNFGSAHLREITLMDNVEVVALCDVYMENVRN